MFSRVANKVVNKVANKSDIYYHQEKGRTKKQGELLVGELSKLPNIGKTVEEQLNQVGINTADELKGIGAKEAWLKGEKAISCSKKHSLAER